MLKKFFLLLLVSTNLCAISRLEDYNSSTVAMTTTVVAAVIIISNLHAMDSEQLEEFMTKLCSGDSKEITNILKWGLIIAVMTVGVLKIPIMCSYPQELYERIFPTIEQQIKNAQASDTLKFLKAQANFRTCLFASKPESERTHLNCPTDCKELLNKFIANDGQDTAIKMINNFDQIWK